MRRSTKSSAMESVQMPNSTFIPEDTQSHVDLSDTFGNLLKLIVHIIVVLFGLPGNCLILRVYWRKTHKTSTHVLIMALAWADLTVCVLAVYRIYVTVAQMSGNKIHDITFVVYASEGTAIGSSILLTAVIAADRFDCICRPHRRFFTHKRGKITAWAAFVASLIINIPGFIPQPLGHLRLALQVVCFAVALVMIALCYGKVYMTIKKHTKVGVKSTLGDSNVTQITDEWSTRQQNPALIIVRPKVSAVASVSTFISKPCSSQAKDASRMAQSKGTQSHEIEESTLDGSGKRVASVSTATSTKKEHSPNDTEPHVANGNPDSHQGPSNTGRAAPKADATVLQRKTTRMLFITSVVFLLTWLPHWIRVAATLASSSDPVFNTIFQQLYVTLFVNNAVNPLIYGLANRRFRKDCKTVLSKMKLC